MTQQFATIKRKCMTSALLHSLALGLCCALVASGTVLLALKLCKIDIDWWWYILVGFGAFVFSFCTLFLALAPSNSRLAKKLDEEYALGERVQTSIEFSSSNADMAQLQRQDAQQKLSSIKRKKLGWQKILLNCILPIVCISVFVTAIALPTTIDNPLQTDDLPPTVDIGVVAKTRLENLIDNIDASSLLDDIKDEYLTELRALHEYTSQKLTQEDRTSSAQASLDEIIAITKKYATYQECATALADVFSLTVQAIESSALYYTSLGDNDLANYSAISGLVSDIEKVTDAMVANSSYQLTADIFASITGEESEDWAIYTLTFATYANVLSASMQDMPDCELKASFATLLQIMQKWGSKVQTDGYSLSAISEQFSLEVTKSFNPLLAIELSYQAYTKLIERHTIVTLCNIFGLEIPQKDAVNEDSTFKPGTAPSNKTDADEKVYPSENELFDKTSQTYLHYVQVYEKYSGNLSQIINDPNVPQELLQIIRAFYENFQKA